MAIEEDWFKSHRQKSSQGILCLYEVKPKTEKALEDIPDGKPQEHLTEQTFPLQIRIVPSARATSRI